MERVMVYITTPDLDVARRIARALVEERLAACANILPGMESFYRWEGAVLNDQEVVLIAKTRSALLVPLTERVIALHPYEVPCVVALPVNQGHEPFLRWIDAATGAV
jgi:periplasmic divalent cation tolerance protein